MNDLPPITTLPELQRHLQAAVALELATIPVYLSGQWTIPDPTDPCARLIGGVAVAEMGHMAIACNCLIATGGTPNITGAAPSYPTYLPDGEDELELSLLPFGRAFLRQAMAIEKPDAPETPPAMQELVRARKAIPRRHRMLAMGNVYPTIGDFYRSIILGIQSLAAQLGESVVFPDGGSPSRQVPSFEGQAIVVSGSASAVALLTHVVDEGEGASGSMWDENDNLAHHYVFQEISLGRLYQKGDVPGKPTGAAIAQPASVVPMLPNPTMADFGPITSPEYQHALAFNRAFTTVVTDLETAFTGRPAKIGLAFGAMFALPRAAAKQFADPVPDNPGLVCGPTFHVEPAWQAMIDADNSGTSPTWNDPIKEYFTPGDIACMKEQGTGVDLGSYASVVEHAADIHDQLDQGLMPPGNRWPAPQVAIFHAWMTVGFPEGTPTRPPEE